eukprot:5614850-Prymnesium_polylepis.1
MAKSQNNVLHDVPTVHAPFWKTVDSHQVEAAIRHDDAVEDIPAVLQERPEPFSVRVNQQLDEKNDVERVLEVLPRFAMLLAVYGEGIDFLLDDIAAEVCGDEKGHDDLCPAVLVEIIHVVLSEVHASVAIFGHHSAERSRPGRHPLQGGPAAFIPVHLVVLGARGGGHGWLAPGLAPLAKIGQQFVPARRARGRQSIAYHVITSILVIASAP